MGKIFAMIFFKSPKHSSAESVRYAAKEKKKSKKN